MNVVIRNMVHTDTEKVQEVAKESWNSTYEGIIPYHIQENFLNMAYSNEMMEKRLKESTLLVAEIDNEVVGFSNFSQVNQEGQVELSAIYLHLDYQGEGIGTALLQKGIEALKNIKEVYIDVEKENIVGKTFYEAKGFKIIKEYDDNFDGHILKTVRMVLKI